MPDERQSTCSQRKPNLRALAYEHLTQSLSTAKLRPGQFVSQREFVKITGLPLAAIREVIPRLEAERLLVTIPQRGMQIANVDVRMLREVFELWLILARPASERLSGIASTGVFDDLEQMHQDIIDHDTRPPDATFLNKALTAEDHFHGILVAILDNAIISDIYRVNKIKLDMIRSSQGGLQIQDAICSAQERMTIIQMAKQREKAQTIRAMEAHVKATMQRAFALLGSPPSSESVIFCEGKGIAA